MLYHIPLGTLYITNVVEADQQGNQLYKCYAQNVKLDSGMGGSYTRISIKGMCNYSFMP